MEDNIFHIKQNTPTKQCQTLQKTEIQQTVSRLPKRKQPQCPNLSAQQKLQKITNRQCEIARTKYRDHKDHFFTTKQADNERNKMPKMHYNIPLSIISYNNY